MRYISLSAMHSEHECFDINAILSMDAYLSQRTFITIYLIARLSKKRAGEEERGGRAGLANRNRLKTSA